MRNLKIFRKKKGLTQCALGEKINVSGEAICQYEKGKRKPNIYILRKISKELNCTIEELIEDRE